MKKRKLLVVLFIACIQNVIGQNVTIPDAQFKSYLVGNASINTNGDAEIQVSEAQAYNSGIWVSGSGISSLQGIEAFVNATNLNCSGNSITTLDLSSNTSLTQVNANNNQLTQLNLANGTNTSIGLGWFSATGNPNLTCIQVDNVSYSTSNWNAIDPQSSYSTNCNYPCDVFIPDANFKTYLLGEPAINTNGDNEIQCSEASSFTGTMDCQALSISDLTGIEEFTAMTYLICMANQLTSLDLSSNTALANLDCAGNQLTSLQLPSGSNLQFLNCSNNNLSELDITQNSAVVTLYCFNNQLTSLDVTTNTDLSIIEAYDNQITALNVSPLLSLEALGIDNNQLTSLDVTANPALQTLNCGENSISSLDVTSNPFLTYFFCGNNALSVVDVSQNMELVELVCSFNQLTSLDISSNPNVTRVACTDNLLTELNVANGNNTNFNSFLFYATNNPNLTCIQVDDAAYSTANWLNVDAQASFDTDCGLGLDIETVGQAGFTVYPNPANDIVQIMVNPNEVQEVIIMDASGKVILESSTPVNTYYDISTWFKGVYFIQVKTTESVVSEQFIKQ